MTRDEALAKLAEPLYDAQELETDIAYLCKKLRITRGQFDEFLSGTKREYSDFPNWDRLHRTLKAVQVQVERVVGRRVNVYS